MTAVLRQHLDRHAAVHHDVLGQVDAAHAAGAQMAQQLVLAEEKALVLAVQQVVALPAREQAGGDQARGKEVGVVQPRRGSLANVCRQARLNWSASTSLLRSTVSINFSTDNLAMTAADHAIILEATSLPRRGNLLEESNPKADKKYRRHMPRPTHALRRGRKPAPAAAKTLPGGSKKCLRARPQSPLRYRPTDERAHPPTNPKKF